jgi:hypothetical protein
MNSYVVVVGNPEMGYTLHGPFDSEMGARDWIDEQDIVEHSVCIMDLHPATEGYYKDDDEEEDQE